MTPIISARSLTKRYGGVVALDGLNLDVASGVIHAVVGENGAGKSTLMKVLAGVVKPEAGAILFDGAQVAIDSPAAARRRGVGMVYQELSLFPERSVLANLFVNREPLRRGLVSTRAMEEMSRELLDRLGLHVDVRAPVGRLSIGEQQLVELARVLLEKPLLLILDEPNSALNKRETDRLFAILQQLREQGVTMLYVSHRLEEVFAISDRVTVARNGKDVLTRDRAGLAMSEVIEAMIGAEREYVFPPPTRTSVTQASELRVEALSGGELEQVSFAARSGEVVGLAGLEGAGVQTLLAILFGARKARSGQAVFPDSRGLPRTPTEAARRGVCLVPADRKRNGLMLERSILFNISQVAVGAVEGGFSLFSRARATARAVRQIERLRIRTPSAETLVNHLSGGNQQKVLIAKWLEIEPRTVLLDDPTRGVDIGAKREIYQLIRQMSADGRIVVFSSTELPELIGLCDRILVLYRGRLVDELVGDEIDNHTLLHLINTGERPPTRTDAVP